MNSAISFQEQSIEGFAITQEKGKDPGIQKADANCFLFLIISIPSGKQELLVFSVIGPLDDPPPGLDHWIGFLHRFPLKLNTFDSYFGFKRISVFALF